MGKYNSLTILKRVKAWTQHSCTRCRKAIFPGEVYYRGHIVDQFLHSLHAKAYCSFCGEKVVETTQA